MSLTSKQRAALRGMANTMEPVFQIGKGEKLTDGYDIAVIATGLMVPEALRAARAKLMKR